MRDATALLREVGARVAELRRQRGYTQEALSQRLKVNTKYLQRVEQGTENLTLRTVARLATVLDVSPLHLFLPAMTRRQERAGRPTRVSPPPVLKRVAPRPGSREVVPLYTLIAAAGPEGRADLAEVAEWVEVPGRKVTRGSFVLRVRGDSMEPKIPSGSLALFRPPVGDPNRKIVLVEIAAEGAVPYYLVKKLSFDDSKSGSANAHGRAAKLLSLNARHDTLRMEFSPTSGVRIVAELVQVLPEPA